MSQWMLKTGAAKTADFATGLDARREVGRTATVRRGSALRSGRGDCALRVADDEPDEDPGTLGMRRIS